LESLASWLYRWRVALSLAFVAGAVALLPFANVTRVDNDLDAWFSRDDPLYQDYDRFRAEFGGTQPLIIAIRSESPSREAPDPGIFTRERLAFLQDVAGDIERIGGVQRVHSLASVRVLRAETVAGSTGDPAARQQQLDFPSLVDLSRRSPLETRNLALGNPVLRDELVSATGSVTALVVTFDEGRLDRNRAAILSEIYSAVRAQLPAGLAVYYNGSIEINETYNRVTIDNQRRFLPPILLLTLAAVYLLFRSIPHAMVVLTSIVVSVLWTLGIYSLLGFGFNILTAMLTPLIVVLAISDDVHLIQHYEHERRSGTAQAAFTSTVSYMFTPLAGASGTTALGLLALATSDVVAVRHFGIGAAIGVMVDFAMSLVLVPTLLGWLPRPKATAPERAWLRRSVRAAAALAVRRPRVVLAVAAIVTVGAIAGVARLRVDTNHIRFFAPSHPLSRSAGVIDRELSGVYSFHVWLEGHADSLNQPEAMMRLDGLSAAIRALPDVRKVTSVADHVKRVHQEIGGDRDNSGGIPRDPLMLAQELLLFSLSDDGRRELERLVSSDYSRAQIIVRLPSMGSDRVFSAMEDAQRLASMTFANTGITATVTGSGRLFATLDHYLVRSQVSSFATAFLTIFAAMFLIFRSVRYGILAIVPNVFPVVVVLGVMGWLDISLNVATVMVAAVALGIVDDDTVHFLHRFRHGLAHGASLDRAAENAGAIEGRAALVTALVNSSGFAVLMLSEYKPSAWFGGLLALTLGIAFLAEVFLLPALVMSLRRFLVLDTKPAAR
jgi:predicted RND superfamily exporter protein